MFTHGGDTRPRIARWARLVGAAVVVSATVGTAAFSVALAATADQEAFIGAAGPPAQRSDAQYQVPASVTVAQAILESGWGKSGLATQDKNYFGIKCTDASSPGPIAIGCASWPTTECDPTCHTVTAYFRVYSSMADSFQDHGRLLRSNDRYASAFTFTDEPDQFIREVARAGYATSPTYADDVINLMRAYNLYRFDGGGVTTRSASGLDAVSWGPGRVDVVARSGDNRLIHRYFQSGVWSAWETVGTITIASDPSITSWGARRLDVFARTDHDQLAHVYFDGTGWFSEVLAGTITSGPEAVAQQEGRLDVVARGGSNQLVHLYFDRATGGWAARWDHHGGFLTSDPTITSWAPGRLDVFAADDKSRLVHLSYTNGAWTPWEALTGEASLSSAPDAVAWGEGRLDVVARNNAKQLAHLYYSNGTWGGEVLGNTLSGPPTISSWGQQRLDIFFPDAAKNMTQYYHDTTGWHGWVSLGKLPVAQI
jgi:Mannosyl-glycoprotein endo-beta-N-acetylglucosaminidase